MDQIQPTLIPLSPTKVFRKKHIYPTNEPEPEGVLSTSASNLTATSNPPAASKIKVEVGSRKFDFHPKFCDFPNFRAKDYVIDPKELHPLLQASLFIEIRLRLNLALKNRKPYAARLQWNHAKNLH